MTDTITKSALLSDRAIAAFRLAEYRLSHNARYHDWTDEQRVAYCLTKAFYAAHKVDTETRSSRET